MPAGKMSCIITDVTSVWMLLVMMSLVLSADVEPPPAEETAEVYLPVEEPVKNAGNNIYRDEELSLLEGRGKRAFTFAENKSFIQVDASEIPLFQLRSAREISFNFRTRLPHGLLLYHSIKNKPTSMPNYELYVMLDQGQVKVLHLFGEFSTVLVVGKGLNRDKWHNLKIRVDPGHRKLYVTVDSVLDVKDISGLDSYPSYGVTERVDSIVFIGGLNTEETQIDISFFANPFVGCIKGITFSTGADGQNLTSINPLIASKHRNITEDCQNRCYTLENLCVHGSRCVNHYNKVTCDCFGTGYEGEYCDYDYPTPLTLRGYSFVTYTVYDWMDRVHSDANLISMIFKTTFDDAVLFYASGALPNHNHIAASLLGGSVYVEADFGGGNISTVLGRNLDTGSWNNLTIRHHGRYITFILNKIVETMEIPGDQHHLRVDPEVYIGGAPKALNMRQSRGLISSKNFVGCLKEVYLNDFSIIYELKNGSPKVKYHGLTKPELGECQEVETIPVTFPFSESYLRFNNTQVGQNFIMKFEFKTHLSTAILVYGNISTAEGNGYFELKRVDTELQLTVVPDITRNSTKSWMVKTKLEAADMWHYVEFRCVYGEMKLMVDFRNMKVEPFDLKVTFHPEIFVGSSLLSPHLGLIGCIRDVTFGEVTQDPRGLVGTEYQFGDVSLDNCEFVDPCKRPNACEHGGKCRVQNGKVECDCIATGYIGKNCHFAMYKRTCEELGLLGYSQVGVYRIDIDGNGPYQPAYVKCSFEPGAVTKTIVEHNLPMQTDVRASTFDDFTVHITYREFTPEMLQSLISQSVQCQQSIKYECYKAPIGLHSYTWFKSSGGKSIIDSIGDAKKGRCNCSENEAEPCLNRAANWMCNCEGVVDKWESDEGYFTTPQRIGVTDMYFMQPKTLANDALGRITLGSVECVEANTQRFVVTFKTLGSYLEVPAWKSGELAFSFRTTGERAILLYQPPLHKQHSSFLVMLTSGNDITFSFTMSGQPFQLLVKSPRKLNTGEWQQVWIDYDEYHVRFTLNREYKMIDLQDGQKFGPFEGTLYVAGAPEEYLQTLEVSEGLIGCFRGLVINGQVLDLYSYMKFHRADIVKDCKPSCDGNPCLNGATCIEHWGSFDCACANRWAHSGVLCEENINLDGLTFLTPRAYIRKAHDSRHTPDQGPSLKEMLTDNIYINLRTYEENALILYANDNFNNFVQLHIQDGRRVVFTFNIGNVIEDIVLDYPGLSHGKSIQIAVVRQPDNTVLHVNDKRKESSQPLKLMEEYNRKPWTNPARETFFPPRPFAAPSEYYQAYLGGFDGEGLQAKLNTSKIQGYVGCLRGLKVGNQPIQIQASVETGLKRDVAGIIEGCHMVCDNEPCKNGGLCIEDFKNKIYTCDCEYTSYFGHHCTSEKGAAFDGEALLQRRFQLQGGVTDVKFQLAFSCKERKNVDTALLLAQTSHTRTYYFLVSLTYDGHLRIQEDRENFVFGAILTTKNFFDGARHSVYYKRTHDQAFLLVDQEEVSLSIVGASGDADHMTYITQYVDELQVGGVKTEDPRFQEYANFKGCLSNVHVKINNIEMKPLEEYMGFIKADQDKVTVINSNGIKLEVCSAFDVGGTNLPPENETQQAIGPEWFVDPPERRDYKSTFVQPLVSNAETERTVFTVMVVLFLVIVCSMFIYMYRVHKQHKKRTYEDEEEEAFFRHKGHPVHYTDHAINSTVKYVSFKQAADAELKLKELNDSSELNALTNQHEYYPLVQQVQDVNFNARSIDENLDELKEINREEPPYREEETSSETETGNAEEIAEAPQHNDPPQSEETNADSPTGNTQFPAISEEEPAEPAVAKANGVPAAVSIPSSTVNKHPQLPPVFLSEGQRTFGNPISYLGGPRLLRPNSQRASKESVLSLD